ncbi:MAG: hypothetical protein IPM69_00455 [Ignavibacteria bacterium]|nr:hypothetical protein [Ignavibacteria bacterium]
MKSIAFFAVGLLFIVTSLMMSQVNSPAPQSIGKSYTVGSKTADPTLKMSVLPKKIKGKAGSVIIVKFNVKIPKKWHLYGIELQENKDGIGPQPTEITLKDSTPTFVLGAIKSPKTHVEYDEGFEMDVTSIAGNVTFNLPITIAEDATAGMYKSMIAIYFQMCDGKTCLTPHEETVPFEVEIVR